MLPLFATPSDDLNIFGATALRSYISTIEQRLQVSEEKLKTQEYDLLGRVSTADELVQNDSISSLASLK